MAEAQAIIRLENIRMSFDDTDALSDVSLTIKNGEFLTLLGPSGCGKTTILRLIAGFESPTSGTITINNTDVSDVPPEKRQVNTVFQSYALFPHMSVFDNVAFGLKMSKTPKGEIEQRVHEALNMVGLTKFARRSPGQLSGGQQQRVAIARAVVNNPLVLLLDEPLSALDSKLRKQMQLELKHLQRKLGITFVFVTHDQEEAMAMSDRIVVMDEGHIEQVGSPVDVYEEPASLFVANFVGETNFLDATIEGRDGKFLVANVEGRRMRLRGSRDFPAGEKVRVMLRPEDLRVEQTAPEGTRNNWLPGVITETIYKGKTWDMTVRLESGTEMLVTEFFDEDAEDMWLKEGQHVFLSWFDGWEVVLPDEGA